MNNAKMKELEIKILDFVCDDWKDKEVKTKIDNQIVAIRNDICYNNFKYGGVKKHNYDS